ALGGFAEGRATDGKGDQVGTAGRGGGGRAAAATGACPQDQFGGGAEPLARVKRCFMAKLNIEQTHALPVDEVKKRLQGLADKLAEKYGIQAKWTSDRQADIKRTGVSRKI